jgi:hypothetical protein
VLAAALFLKVLEALKIAEGFAQLDKVLQRVDWSDGLSEAFSILKCRAK